MTHKNHRKRICALLLAAVMFLGGFCALIDTKQGKGPQYLGKYSSDPTAQAIQAKLYEGLLLGQSAIDISSTPVPVTEFSKIYVDLRYSTPSLYMVEARYSYSYKTINNVRYVTKVYPSYNMTQDEIAKAQLIWADKIQSIAGSRNPYWNAAQTALYLHDYLALNAHYDKSYTYYDAYTLFTKGTGVCMAYTLAYDALLEAVGIHNDYTDSDEMNHIWNRVYIGGSPYNVDVTWDDPSLDRLGQVQHRHFLVSDSVLDDNHQYTWDEGYGQCSSTHFDDWFWRDVNTAFIPVGDDFYFIYKGSFYKWTADNRLVKCVSLSSKWYADSKKRSYWYSVNTDGSKNLNFSVLWPAGDKILYNATSSIKTFDPKTNKLETVYKYTGSGNICGFSYDGSTLTLQVGYNPWKPQECEIITIPDFYVS